jgi:hypothetical protein
MFLKRTWNFLSQSDLVVGLLWSGDKLVVGMAGILEQWW